MSSSTIEIIVRAIAKCPSLHVYSAARVTFKRVDEVLAGALTLAKKEKHSISVFLFEISGAITWSSPLSIGSRLQKLEDRPLSYQFRDEVSDCHLASTYEPDYVCLS